ncbi:hypothetical protein T07_821, partial [Trichinella nelsoni]
MPGVGLEIFNADKGECEIFPCCLGRQSTGFWILKRGKSMLISRKRLLKLCCFSHLGSVGT